MDAEEVYQDIIESDFIENTAVIINKENKSECRVYVECDIGGYNNLVTGEYHIPNCSDEDYKMLTKLPKFRGFKEMRSFHSRNEYGINYSKIEFLYLIGRIW